MDKRRKDENLDPRIERFLSFLNEVPSRNPEKAARTREKYLNQVKTLPTPVSVEGNQRQMGWLGNVLNPLRIKEHNKMLSTLTAIFLAIIVVFGGSGATALAAQTSLPDDVLYPVKTFTEDLRLDITVDPVEKVDLLGEYTNRRVDEIASLVSKGLEIPEEAIIRYVYQMDLLLGYTANLEGDEVTETLKKVQVWIHDRDRVMDMTMKGMPETVDPRLETLRHMLMAQNRVVEEGLETPLEFQQQFQYRANKDVDEIEILDDAAPVEDPEEPVDGEETGNGPGPDADGENKPEDGYGPGEFQGELPEDYEEGDGGMGPGPGTPPEDHGEGSSTEDGYNYWYNYYNNYSGENGSSNGKKP